MRVRELPSADILRQLLDYDPKTGVLRWKPRTPDMFTGGRNSAEMTCNQWNGRRANTEALAALNGSGYRHGSLLGRYCSAHRVIWKLVTGEEPDCIDHINGDPSDNRFANLRSVSYAENHKNKRRPTNNKSGVAGVFWEEKRQWWIAYICEGRKQRQIGWFKNKEDAIACRLKAERERGFHPNHGR